MVPWYKRVYLTFIDEKMAPLDPWCYCGWERKKWQPGSEWCYRHSSGISPFWERKKWHPGISSSGISPFCGWKVTKWDGVDRFGRRQLLPVVDGGCGGGDDDADGGHLQMPWHPSHIASFLSCCLALSRCTHPWWKLHLGTKVTLRYSDVWKHLGSSG